MKGYWNIPEATREAIDADGWFRTGDAGYLDADGYLYIHDRVKDMIVSGGENVYPAEVENVLMGHPAVADVAVIGVPTTGGARPPRRSSCATPGADAAEPSIIAFAREHLAIQVPDQRRVDRRAAAQPQRQDPEEGAARPVLGGPRPPRQLAQRPDSGAVGRRKHVDLLDQLGARHRRSDRTGRSRRP